MRRLLVLALLVAAGCAKGDNKDKDMAGVTPTKPGKSSWTDEPTRLADPGPKGPKAKPRPTEKSPFDFQPQTTKEVKLDKPAPNDVAAAVREFIGGAYTNINITGQSDAVDYPVVPETNQKGWVVAVSFQADNPTLKCSITATDHLFLLSKKGPNERVQAFYHASDPQLGKAKLGEQWYNLNNPPEPKTKTTQ